MVDSAKVSVVKYPDRVHLVLRWKDPVTGKSRCKSSGTAKRRDAERAAATLEREIAEGQHGPAARMSWRDFREYHEQHCLSAMKRKSVDAYAAALNAYERFHTPERLRDVTPARVTAWQTQLRTDGKAEASIVTYTKHLKAVLNWAKSQGLLAVVPKIALPKRAKGAKLMKGRPITTEEFERMLAAVPRAIGARPTTSGVDTVTPWRHYLRGLWWSGLRLGESLILEWNGNTPGALVVDFSGRRPMLRIPAESDKGGRDRLLPMAPEFAEFLQATPQAERHGRVFKLMGTRFHDARMLADWVSRVVCRIGRTARVMVDQRERRLEVDNRRQKGKPRTGDSNAAAGDDGLKRKYASAHDLRRAFGRRWSALVMPAVLQQLMRHESIETTMRYYVGRDADAIADALWEAVSTKSGNIRPNSRDASAKEKPQTFAG